MLNKDTLWSTSTMSMYAMTRSLHSTIDWLQRMRLPRSSVKKCDGLAMTLSYLVVKSPDDYQS
ncbi:hypothetical protein KAX35_09375 [candidate division WOR-3 bacterium]|nr:hypothetical protein [candidate division WOR-3 bacterium]